MSRDTDVLVRALGELAMTLHKHRPGNFTFNRNKRTIYKWLHSLKGEEMASLSCVVDAGFVKTLLLMGSRSRACRDKYTCVHEFQLLPQAASIAYKRTSTNTLRRNAARDFVKRPIIRTADGDFVSSFHTKEYEVCCSKLLGGLRVLNTFQSCDTVALSMDFFQPVSKRDKTFAAEFFYIMEVIAHGNFLMERPSDTALKHRTWGETKWLRNQSFYSIQALFVNQIELNIWAAWRQRQKDVNFEIPLQGLASKLFLAREWEMASSEQQNAVLKVLASRTIAHVKDLKQLMTIEARAADMYKSARFSLEALISILIKTTGPMDHGAPVDICFTVSFEDAFVSPQTSIMKLIQAEYFQEQCSLLLCERLSKKDEKSLLKGTAQISFSHDSMTDDGCKKNPKSSNHSQRRRASRKKMMKQRRIDNEIRAAQHTRFQSVLRELLHHFRQKQKEAVACADKQLHRVITPVVDSQLTPGGLNLGPEDRNQGSTLMLQTTGATVSSSVSFFRTNNEEYPEKCSVATAGSESSSAERDKLRQADYISNSGIPRGDGSQSSCFSNDRSTRTATASISPTSSLPLLSFETHGLYSSATTTPYFLSLVSQDEQSSRALHRESDKDGVDSGKNQFTCDDSRSVALEDHLKSETSNLEWYLPSVFSLQTPPQRTLPPMPSLDWHFDHWQLRASDGGISDKGVSSSMAVAELDPLLTSSSSLSASPASSSRFNNTRLSGSTKKYSLASFSKIAGLDASRCGIAQSDYDKSEYTRASIREHDKGDMTAADESDFLYQEGGFFDRQRSLKRRRRPWPLNDTHENDNKEIAEETDDTRRCVGVLTRVNSDAWAECVNCCNCACHRNVCLRDQEKNSSEEKVKIHRNNLEHQYVDKTSHLSAQLSRVSNDDTYAKLTVAFERITQLEDKFAERTKIVDEQATNTAIEIATLKQNVATLTAQLINVENSVQELQQQSSISVSRLEDSSLGNASSCSSPPAPFSPAPSVEQQIEHPSTAAFPAPDAFATTNSAMGPFVSVPLSVLPPRSKLHWDLCEFAAQLQADSDARLPAQLAAQQLCTATVQSLWPRAQVRPYGSHVTRLVLPSSDVDLVICLPKVRRDAPADAAGVLEGRNAIKETWQQNLARKLKQEPWVVRDSVKTLPHAAVPIITLLTAPPYNVRLDISFEGPGHNGLATNDVVLALLHEFPPLAPMMLVLKSFAIERGLAVAYTGGLSSYALLLLVARYLQEHSDTMPNGFANASRAVQHSLSTAQAGVADFGLMLMGFLNFYGNRFDPRTTDNERNSLSQIESALDCLTIRFQLLMLE
ncbi:DNA polymerase sigma [Plasmopara halstedii]|uniref:DNA polymerase sigma n=1 Tax=Plasmopara halstedii TaxID=4781 RepID=A0A0P1AN18_PLAHL|nr:DNA polymerase sigma [Plasmopara halstedii]CEG42361.1 DNA polymerase sigma [Plasmopara halstedii]|eukprot:XP_024578730.1 DNA polymerase sigma [Plasmopara halstedii]